MHKSESSSFIGSATWADRQAGHINIYYEPLIPRMMPGKTLLIKKSLEYLLQLDKVLGCDSMKDFADLGLISKLFLTPSRCCQFVRHKAIIDGLYIWTTGNHGNEKLYDFLNWGVMNGFHLDLKVLFKEVNEPDLLSIVASGNKKSCDGEVIEVSQLV
ncbi:MAG: hypothetical protein ACE5K3_09475, partial [bacterium]